MSEILDQETESRLMSGFLAGDASALAHLALLAAIQLRLAVSAEAVRQRDSRWEDAGQQVCCDLLEKPANVLKRFRLGRGRLLNYLLGRVRGRMRDLHRTDQRYHQREQDAWTKKTDPGPTHPIDWEEIEEQVGPSLTLERRLLARRLLADLAARRCEGYPQKSE